MYLVKKNPYDILSDDFVNTEEIFSPIIQIDPIKKNTAGYKISYEKKIEIIREYFGVSEMCAIYLYHRRRRGVPWYKPGDIKYLEWSIQLQNAILHLDTVHAFDWRGLEFGYEEIQFIKNNIDLNYMSSDISVLTESSNIYSENKDKDGFIKVGKNKINITRELNKMGLIPRAYCTHN